MVPSSQSDARHSALASEPRRRVLALLSEALAPIDAVTVAAGIGLHVTTARFHLEQLEAAGLIERTVARAGQRGRPHVLFSPVVTSPAADPQQQLTRALAGVIGEDDDGGRARSVRAGERWSEHYVGAAAAAAPSPPVAAGATASPSPTTTAPARAGAERTPDGTDRAGPEDDAASRIAADLVPPLLRVLDEIGFDPVLQPESGTIALPSCPFRDEARQNPDVVCNVHLGLIRGLARSLGHNAEGITLRPFVQPHLCLVDLPAGLEH